MTEFGPHHHDQIVQAHRRLDAHDARINTMEISQAREAERSVHIQRSLGEIQSGITWINTVTPRFLIGSESVIISDRRTTGTAVVEAASLATADWFARAIARTRGSLSLIHGKTAGNIVEISAPAIEIGKVTQGQTDGILNYSLPLSLCPVTGMDELRIIAR